MGKMVSGKKRGIMFWGILIGIAGAYVFSSGMMAIIVSFNLIQAPLIENVEQEQ